MASALLDLFAHAREGFVQLLSGEWLGYVGVEAGFLESLFVARHSIGREGEGGGILIRFHGAELSQEIDSGAFLAKVDVEDEKIENLLARGVQGILYVGNDLEYVFGTQQVAKKKLSIRIVFNGQNARLLLGHSYSFGTHEWAAVPAAVRRHYCERKMGKYGRGRENN